MLFLYIALYTMCEDNLQERTCGHIPQIQTTCTLMCFCQIQVNKKCMNFFIINLFQPITYLYEVTCSIDSIGTSKPHSSWISILAISVGLTSLSISPAQSSYVIPSDPGNLSVSIITSSFFCSVLLLFK